MSVEFTVNYKVQVTKAARRQGRGLPITLKERLEIIGHLKNLKFWPDIKDEFDFEKVGEAYEFKFNTSGHWVRVFVYQDDERKFMNVIKVIVKKTNQLTTSDKISLKTAVSDMKEEIDHFKREREKEKKKLHMLKGGKKDE